MLREDTISNYEAFLIKQCTAFTCLVSGEGHVSLGRGWSLDSIQLRLVLRSLGLREKLGAEGEGCDLALLSNSMTALLLPYEVLFLSLCSRFPDCSINTSALPTVFIPRYSVQMLKQM